MRNSAFLAMGILLLVIQSNLFRILDPLHIPGSTPNLLLPLVVFMGVHEYSMARGAALSVIIGYFYDIFASVPVGLFTFITVAIFVVARIAGIKLAAQTILTKLALAFAFGIIEGGLIVVLTAIFGNDTPRTLSLSMLVLPHAIATAVFAPFVFRVAEGIHQMTVTVPRPGEGGGSINL